MDDEVSSHWRAHAPFRNVSAMHHEVPDHYATLGLHRRCTEEQIRAAYRILAKQLHPDVNGAGTDAIAKMQALNAAYETLGNPELRRDYDRELKAAERAVSPAHGGRIERNVSQELRLSFEELLRGATLEVRVNDPANPAGAETYELVVPPGTAPGARFRIPREGTFRGGSVIVKVKARPDFRFRPRCSDLRCDLRISAERAKQGGSELIRGLTGSVRVTIPRGVGRGEILRIAGEGLPKPRGGRGDLLVRIVYRPEVKIRRVSR